MLFSKPIGVGISLPSIQRLPTCLRSQTPQGAHTAVRHAECSPVATPPVTPTPLRRRDAVHPCGRMTPQPAWRRKQHRVSVEQHGNNLPNEFPSWRRKGVGSGLVNVGSSEDPDNNLNQRGRNQPESGIAKLPRHAALPYLLLLLPSSTSSLFTVLCVSPLAAQLTVTRVYTVSTPERLITHGEELSHHPSPSQSLQRDTTP
ncbi:unnamed protein product [Pleuronectes platessa]|uniref:Uncharacterized protein n=1 Tax=Pleuronectes platessa TaxID=8262 RepID=A0A9N7Z8H3_PLEPL|nr:unnamed protein product [Pleuronectes platessa]